MKILQINAVYKNASTGRICFELHNYLKDNGCDCVTVYGGYKGNYDDAIYTGNNFDHKLHALFSRITGKIGYFSKFQTKKIIRFIKKYKPDVVHLHNLHANFICIPKLLKFLAKENIPTVITLHDCFFYTGGCMHYTVNNCYKWHNKCNHCRFNNLTWFFDRTERMFNDKKELFGKIQKLAVIGVSHWIANEASKSPILKDASIIRSIYNGINLSVFQTKDSDFKKKYHLEDTKIILGVASGWSVKKGLNVFLGLADKLKVDEKIVLVGNTPEKIISDKIIQIPTTNNVEELVDIYNAADVFLQASREETFGNVVAEALACGVPVVTNTSTANPELVNEKCGIVLEEFSIDNIYNAISEVLIKGKAQFECRDYAEHMFDKQESYKKYLNVYKEITN